MSAYSTDKRPSSPPPIERVGPYKHGTAPRAAEFGKGARNIQEIREATEARRANSAQWSRKPTEPNGERK
jgi:hypothetical protein